MSIFSKIRRAIRKPLFSRSSYKYTTAAGMAAKRTSRVVKRTTKEIFADGVAFGRSLERESGLSRKRR